MAHHKGNTPPSYLRSYPAAQNYPQHQQASYAMPLPPPHLKNTPQAPQPLHPNMALPPDLQNLNLTPQQIAALFSHFQAQSGPVSHPLPPPPPPRFTVAAVAAPTPAPVPVPAYVPVPAPALVSVPAPEREDGELSDAGERSSPRQTRQGPRKRKLYTSRNEGRLVSQRSSGYDAAQLNGHGHPRPNAASVQDHTEELFQNRANVSAIYDDVSHKKNVVLPFMAALHQEGVTFGDFVQEGLSPTLLRDLYSELQIPVALPQNNKPATATLSSNAATVMSRNSSNGVAATAYTTPTLPLESADPELVKPSNAPVPKITPTTAAPVDRQTYLARLQAAKNKKASVASLKPTTPTFIHDARADDKATAIPSTIPSTTPSASAPGLPSQTGLPLVSKGPLPHHTAPAREQPANKPSDAATELVRKKMEALKAMKRRLVTKQPTPSPTPLHDVASAQARIAPATRSEEMDKTALNTTPPAIPSLQTLATAASGFSVGGIPGLFMMTDAPKHATMNIQKSTPSGSVTPSFTPKPSQVILQDITTHSNPSQTQAPVVDTPQPAFKPSGRPVAADLNETQTSSEPARYKRPFGRSRQNSSDDAMIIEVSDDEGTVGDDEVENIGTISSRQKAVRDLPSLRDFPQRIAQSKTGLFQGTSTPLATPGTASDAEELRRKELEISTLQLRIQEYERRKKSLKAKVQTKLNSPDAVSVAQAIPSGIDGVENSFASSPAVNRQSVGVALSGIAVDTVPAPVSVNGETSSDKHSKLKASISASDAMLNKRRIQMLELQKQMEELQKQCEEEERKKQDLREELEGLDINTDGMTHLEMQARKDEINEQTQGVSVDNESDAMQLDSDDSADVGAASDSIPDARAANSTNQNTESPSEEGQISEGDKMINHQDESNTAPIALSSRSNVGSQATTVDEDLPSGGLMQETPTTTQHSEPSQHNLNPALHESTDEDGKAAEVGIARLFVGNVPFSTTNEELTALFSAFDVLSVDLPLRGKKPTGFAFINLPLTQATAAMEQLNNTALGGRNLIVQRARLKDAPAHVLAPTQATTPAEAFFSVVSPDTHDSAADTSSSDDEMDTSESSDEEDDEEEEEEEENLQETTLAPVVPTNQESSEASVDERDVEKSESSEMELNSSESEDESEYEPAAAMETPPVVSEQSTQFEPAGIVLESVADNLAPELQVDHHQQTSIEVQQNVSNVAWPRYENYESSLKMFKKYRFHPDYLQNVAGGYHSLTYSHRIRQDVPLCRYEFAGGICQDQSCEGQHWRDMTVSDDQLLIQLGTKDANPGKKKEEITRYNIGLKGIIQQLRQEETSDTETVGARISQYRRQFLGDATIVVTR